jgi:transcriptional regulator with XRE-family HTH domain
MPKPLKATKSPRSKPEPTPEQAVGRHIRRLRVQRGQTQDDVAKASGFTKSLLSKIETGDTQPPVATLVKIAGALGTSLSALLEHDTAAGPVFTAMTAAVQSLARTEKGYSAYPFAASLGAKKMQPFLFEVRKGKVKPHALSHTGEEFLFVIEGEILFRVGNVEYRMRAGDSLYFDATHEHGVMAVSEVARYLDIFC